MYILFHYGLSGCENWTTEKAEHQRIDAFKLWFWRRVLKSPLDAKEVKPVNPKGNQPWIFIGNTDAMLKLQLQYLATDVKSWLTGKDPDAGKDWGQKGAAEDEMVGWHYRLSGHEFEQTLGDGEGQGSLA